VFEEMPAGPTITRGLAGNDSAVHCPVIQGFDMGIQLRVYVGLENSPSIEVYSEVKKSTWLQESQQFRQGRRDIDQIQKSVGDKKIPWGIAEVAIHEFEYVGSFQPDHNIPVAVPEPKSISTEVINRVTKT
jgi:hypothetical protein